MSHDDPRSPEVGMDAHADGQARIYQLAQGIQHIHHHYAGPRVRATVVVEQVPAHGAAAGVVFVGRDAHVGQLLDLLDPAGSGPAATVVSAVAGLAGVGKTALARHVAGLAVGRGWFPGGAVLVDVHGYDPDSAVRVGPGQVFAPVLRALGVPSGQVPLEVDEQAAVYHQVLTFLAEQQRPVLLVLDNASAAEQVAGLLPRHSVHRALVTSRHTLGDLDGIHVLDVDVLGVTEAVDLVDQALRERDPADQRAVNQPGQAAELARVCGGLPLALRIAAALLADDPGQTVAELVDELADAATRLDTLRYGTRAVAGAFDLSWRHLHQRDPHAARLFRLLPVNPGPDIATAAAAVLVNQPPAWVRPLLRVLRQAHLIEPGAAVGRWRMHNLVHAYATGLPVDANNPGERDTATGRLLDHYLTTADAADDYLRALPGQPAPDRFTGRPDALAWLDAERTNLVAAVDLATATGDHDSAFRLALTLAAYLSRRRHLDDWVTTAVTACNAAQHLGDRHGEGIAWGNLGSALAGVRRFDEAITAHQHDLKVCRDTGDRHGEGIAWGNLGLALVEVRRFDEAIEAHHTAGDIFRQAGDRHREGMAWNNLGNALQQVRRFDEAITAYETARDIYRETGDRHREGTTWGNLGTVLVEVRRFDEAITAHQHDLEICRETDAHQGSAWTNLGLALVEVRRFDEAITAHQHAGDIFRQAGDRHREGIAWNNLGLALAQVRQFDEAITAHESARDIYRETGDRHREGTAWGNLGLALVEVRRFDETITAHHTAIDIFRETGDRHREGTAWGDLGSALAQVRRFDEAITALEQAVAAYTKSGAAEDADKVRHAIKAIKDTKSESRPQP